MYIVWGSSVKHQALGPRSATCVACRQETTHVLMRNYAVRHVYWFPLFSTNASYTKACERCNLITPTGEPAPGTVRREPFLHRMGFIFPVGFLVLPMLFALVGIVFGAGAGKLASAGSEATSLVGVGGHFHTDDTDRAARSAVQALFDRLDTQRTTVTATSARIDGHTVRLLTAQYSQLRRMNDRDRLRLMSRIEEIVDASFAGDEVFLGLKGRLLWGGHAHRQAGDAWIHVVDETDPEKDAFARYHDIELAAAQAPAADVDAHS